MKLGKNIVINGKKIEAKKITYLQKGKKISIVLDTKTNSRIINFVKDSDLLICESTYLDEKELAEKYLHMTVGQACEIAKKSKVKKLILVHFSQKYDLKEKILLNEARKTFKNSFLGEDLMSFII